MFSAEIWRAGGEFGVQEEQCHHKAGLLHHQKVMQGTQDPEEDLAGLAVQNPWGDWKIWGFGFHLMHCFHQTPDK